MIGIIETIVADLVELKTLVQQLVERLGRPVAEDAVTVEEAAKLLTLSVPTVRNHLANGVIRIVKIRGRRVIPRAAIEGILNPPQEHFSRSFVSDTQSIEAKKPHTKKGKK